MTLSEYLKNNGRGALAKLARDTRSHASDMSNWAKENRPIPHEKCVQIEQATNSEVTRKDLRPNDWHLIWPELKEGAA